MPARRISSMTMASAARRAARRSSSTAPSLFLENANELFTDDPAFLLGIDDMGQAGQETLARIDNDERDMQVIAESTSDLLAFTCSQTTSIDENAGELTTYGMVNKQGRDG